MSEAKDKKTIVKYDNTTDDINYSVPENYGSGYKGNVKHGIDRKFVVLIVFAVLLLIVGIVLIVLANVNSCSYTSSSSSQKSFDSDDDICNPSKEADRIRLNDFLVKVRDIYHEVFPEEIAWLPDVTYEVIRNKFKVHDPKPENLKKIWDRANELLNEAIELVSVILLKVHSHLILYHQYSWAF